MKKLWKTDCLWEGLYKSKKDSSVYAIVGRKTGPKTGYLYQYALKADSTGVKSNLVNKKKLRP